jgi:3D (Asp-Asp-Asp) domain-containing protein
MARIISRSVGRKLMVTLVAIVGFVLAYEVSMSDSRHEAPPGVADPTRPAAGSRQLFTATAYCKGTTTASGVGVRTGIAASDPALLPVGSVINITTGNAKYNGVYTIMDTGPKVQGRIIDVYMWSCHEALAFGRQHIELTVLRLGWNPNQSTPSLVDRLFRRREAARNAPPPPLPPPPPQPAIEPVLLEDVEKDTAIVEPQAPPVEPAGGVPVPASTVPGSGVAGSADR